MILATFLTSILLPLGGGGEPQFPSEHQETLKETQYQRFSALYLGVLEVCVGVVFLHFGYIGSVKHKYFQYPKFQILA